MSIVRIRAVCDKPTSMSEVAWDEFFSIIDDYDYENYGNLHDAYYYGFDGCTEEDRIRIQEWYTKYTKNSNVKLELDEDG